MWTWRQLGYHDKPVGLLNTQGYYDSLLDFTRQSTQAGFMGEWQNELIRSAPTASELLPLLINEAGLSTAPRADQL